MKVLIACEESQTVCKAFRERGHEAYSCDIQKPSGGHPEEWRVIPGFPEYEASSLGRIRSVSRTINYSNGRVVHAKQRILRPTMSSGYYSVNLSRANKSTSTKVHILVAAAFLGLNPGGLDVRHKNGCRTDNRAENLEYGTRSENVLDGYKITGKTMVCQKLSPQKAEEIRSKSQSGISQRNLAKEYGVSKSTVAAILHRKIYVNSPGIAKAMAEQWGELDKEAPNGSIH